MSKRRQSLGVVATVIAVAVVVTLARGHDTRGPRRDHAIARALGERGLTVDETSVLWLEQPPFRMDNAVTSSVPVVVRATPSEGDPHDIFVAMARVSPEGVLLGLGRAYNLTETSAVDEQRPVGKNGRFAFIEQPMLGDEAPSTVRLVDLAPSPAGEREQWTRVERLQSAITRLQTTGRIEGLRRMAYQVQPPPAVLAVALPDTGDHLRIDADDKSATIAFDAPQDVPEWITMEMVPERRPGNLVTWAVDRVRTEIGDEAMQYIKAIGFSALDVVLSSRDDITGDTGAEDIADDLGQDSLDTVEKTIVVDPDIGFPPQPLDPWVTPEMPGEGKWQDGADSPFIHQLPGLPPTFVTTFIRSDRRRKTTRVYIALWDPRLVELHMMAGVAEPKSATGATGPGMIPREPTVLKRVGAAMNAGFQALHGEFGMMSDGVIYLPPKPYGATVAQLRDGTTAFGTWPLDTSIPGDILSYRQNMTPIVVGETFNPYNRTWWGGTPADWEDKTHTVRTGICLTKENFIGYFYGADISPEALGQSMIQSRCAYGVALDMNAGHSGLEFYRIAPTSDMPALGRPMDGKWEREGIVSQMDGWTYRARRLIKGMGLMNFPRYIGREGRDYFYLTLRYALPGEKVGDAEWQVKGLPQHGFPYALAKLELALASGKKARVLKLDPRMLSAEAQAEPAGSVEGAPGIEQVVVALNPNEEKSGLSLWFTNNAFSFGEQPLTEPAVRIASAAPARGDKIGAAFGIEDEGGMAIYVEVDGQTTSKDIQALMQKLGASTWIGFAEPLALALGGDTSLADQGLRLPDAADRVVLMRKPGAGAKQIFQGTPIVPFKEWFPLQAQRIRYFKKPKGAEDT